MILIRFYILPFYNIKKILLYINNISFNLILKAFLFKILGSLRKYRYF